ncbi:hypothetical protein NQ314_019580 [Rhamnusium bicolor]|uniref:Uncharacterized protein n=1 Tax=Rhamnusium bicolor TaxID=1586634 RepID=A0AAV8WMX0_9CUCU|nr:hypothetical protein NQ314_019580 [Rhamnusium bicolor]
MSSVGFTISVSNFRLEAAYCGCLPLVPRNLVYPEIYPSECLYNDLEDLYIMLKRFCLEPNLAVQLRAKCDINFDKYSENILLPEYMKLFELNKNV